MEKYKDIDPLPAPVTNLHLSSPISQRSTTFYYIKMVSKVILSVGLIAAAVNSVLAHPTMQQQQSFGDHDIRPQYRNNNNVQVSSTPSTGKGDPGAPEGDGGKVADAVYAGIPTFAHLPYEQCWTNSSSDFDVAFLGAPFDTGTSYRPGARFGPAGIRDGSRRLALYGGYNVPMDINPFQAGARVVDCSDIFTRYGIINATYNSTAIVSGSNT